MGFDAWIDFSEHAEEEIGRKERLKVIYARLSPVDNFSIRVINIVILFNYKKTARHLE